MEARFEQFYRDVYADGTVDHSESQHLTAFIEEANPPPNKLIWLREAAFRVGSEFLTGDHQQNVKVLQNINAIVHTLELACMQPKPYVHKVYPPEEHSVATVGVDASIERAAQQLWDLDTNRLQPGVDYQINVQQGKKPFANFDGARDPLFTFVHERVFKRHTYDAFINLLDNYTRETGVEETVTSAEQMENWTFINAVMETSPMQYCHKYCAANSGGKISRDPKEFKKLLYRIWFDLYARERRGKKDSSGFEHVFVGEVKNGEVSGFHNWIQFYLEEKNGNIDYRGYIKPRSKSDAQTDSNDHVLTLQFAWQGQMKNVGTSMIGVSPEFEFALYTMCFLVGNEQNKVELNTGTDIFDLNIKCFKMARDKIGTSFPEALEHHEA